MHSAIRECRNRMNRAIIFGSRRCSQKADECLPTEEVRCSHHSNAGLGQLRLWSRPSRCRPRSLRWPSRVFFDSKKQKSIYLYFSVQQLSFLGSWLNAGAASSLVHWRYVGQERGQGRWQGRCRRNWRARVRQQRVCEARVAPLRQMQGCEVLLCCVPEGPVEARWPQASLHSCGGDDFRQHGVGSCLRTRPRLQPWQRRWRLQVPEREMDQSWVRASFALRAIHRRSSRGARVGVTPGWRTSSAERRPLFTAQPPKRGVGVARARKSLPEPCCWGWEARSGGMCRACPKRTSGG
jgi:hypothetical protein